MGRRSAAGIVAALALLAACGPERREWRPPETAPGTGPAAFAMVWAGTPLHVAADRRAPTVMLPTDTFVPFRILREREGWVRLETLGASDRAHCGTSVASLEPYRLRLYVPTSALAKVTTREVDQRFEDGTSIHLARGVPLTEASGERLYRAHLGPFSTVVRLEPSAVGTRYLPSAPSRNGLADQMLSPDALTAGRAVLGRTGRLNARLPLPLAVHERRAHGPGEALVALHPRCGRLRVRVPSEAVGGVGLLGRSAYVPPEGPPLVPDGSPVYWANGLEAGVAIRAAPVRDEVEGSAGRRCFRQPLGDVSGQRTAVILCFDARDVIERGAAGRRLAPPG